MREMAKELIVEMLSQVEEIKKLFDIAEWEIYNELYLKSEKERVEKCQQN